MVRSFQINLTSGKTLRACGTSINYHRSPRSPYPAPPGAKPILFMCAAKVIFSAASRGRVVAGCLALTCVVLTARGASLPDTQQLADFTDRYCSSCHNDVDKEGGLDLTTLTMTLGDGANFLTWVKVHDRVRNGEMPPKEKKRPEAKDTTAFLQQVSSSLVAQERDVESKFGRVQRRRLNRSEHQNTLRDLFALPGLRVADQLPEDGELAHFNKVSRALDVSHVHVSRYIMAAQLAIREAVAVEVNKQPTTLKRYYARDNIAHSGVDGVADRMRFPVLGSGPDVRAANREGPITVGDANPTVREEEAMAWSHSDFGPAFNTRWTQFETPITGKYNIRFKAYSVWRGPWGYYERGAFGGNGPNLNLPAGAQLPYTPDAIGLLRDPNGPPPIPARGGRAAAGGRAGGRAGGGFGGGFGTAAARGPYEWHLGSTTDITPGRRNEWIHVYAKVLPANGVLIGALDLTPEPQVFELKNVDLVTGQIITTDAVRFFRSRPGFTGVVNHTNPLLQADGEPAVAFRWMEVEGPLNDRATQPGYELLFGNLKYKVMENPATGVGIRIAAPLPSPEELGGGNTGAGAGNGQNSGRRDSTQKSELAVEIESANPMQDADRLLRNFLAHAYRRAAKETDVKQFMDLFRNRMDRGLGFGASMMTAYTAVLSSQEFVYLDEGTKGKLDDYALATRLALFLSDGAPDAQLRAHAEKGDLHQPAVLRAETERLLASPKSERFVSAFLDYWIELRKVFETTPDMNLYGDYFLDDALVEGGVSETQMFFTELLQKNMPTRNLVDSDFTFLNERLADHYGIPGVVGVKLRRVALPADSLRGGLMTQTSVLKLTANGTTTSPVLRGKWIMERIVGYEIPPPPAAVPAVEPDIRGAVTIRAQLEKHRSDESCAACHRNIDPPGFALESFDVLGGYRDRYRAVAKGQTPEVGFGKNGWPKQYFNALPVDPSNVTAQGKAFADVRDFKKLLLQDEQQIARNLAKQLAVYATGAPIRFSDREKLEAIVAKAKSSDYGVRSIVHAVVQSDLFLNK